MSNIRRQGDAVLLCCNKRKCPALSKSSEKDIYLLKDDFGGEVKLSKEQLLVIQEAVQEIDKS